MKKFLLLMVFIVNFTGVASANSIYTWQPTPADLWDLDHYNYISWGIDIHENFRAADIRENILSVSLAFDNIENWKTEPNILYMHLLETAATGAVIGSDPWYEPSGDFFTSADYSGTQIELDTWINLPASPQDLSYTFTGSQIDTLVDYWSDGNFGIGFDPDCHFNNDGISLIIETKRPVPEPQTLILLGVGLISLAGISRKKQS